MTRPKRLATRPRRRKHPPWGPLDAVVTLQFAASMRWYIEQAAAFLGVVVSVSNKGMHYQFRRGALLLEWWPSTGRTGINRLYTDRRRVKTLRELRKWLVRKTTEYRRGRGLANWGIS